jgi:hypothetical protein
MRVLTTPIELRLRRSQHPFISDGRRASLRAMLPPPRCCRPWAGLAANASDAPCRAPRVSGNPDLFSKNQNRFPRHRVNDSGFHGSERLSSTSALLERNPLSRNAVLVWYESPPPISRLCHRDPASGVSSLTECSRTGQLDPMRDPRALHPRARRAARRLSTSATETIREHDRFRRIDRTPRTAQVVAYLRSSCRGWLRLIPANELPCGCCCRSAASRELRGQGPRPGCFRPSMPRRLPTAIARGGSFAPTRSARTPLVACS